MSWIVAGLERRGGCFNDNADGFGSIVQRGGSPAVGQVGGRSAETQDPKKMDRRFGVRTGVMEGGLFPVIKKTGKKKGELWLGPLFDGAYAAFHGVFNGSSETVALQKPISQH